MMAREAAAREKKASGATMFGYDALASGAGADEYFGVRGERRPPNGTLGQGHCFIPPEVTAEGDSVDLSKV